MTEKPLPLALDLDGTLLRVDTLTETAKAFVKVRPVSGPLLMLVWLLRGRPFLKARLAGLNLVRFDDLPANDALVAYAKAASERGRTIVLATAGAAGMAQAAQQRWPFIAETFSSDGARINLKGRRKADALAARFPQGFVYAGDSRADLAVWKRAQGAIFAGRSAALERRAAELAPLEASFKRR